MKKEPEEKPVTPINPEEEYPDFGFGEQSL